MTAPTETPATTSPAADSQRLFKRLGGPDGAARDAAVAELHALLLKAARFEVDRRRAGLPHHDARRKLRTALRERGIDPGLEREEDR